MFYLIGMSSFEAEVDHMNLREGPVTPDSLRVGTNQHVRKTAT